MDVLFYVCDMESVFIVTDDSSTHGHNESFPIKVLSTYDGLDMKQYPAFKSREDAEKFIDSVSEWGFEKKSIMELPIHEGL